MAVSRIILLTACSTPALRLNFSVTGLGANIFKSACSGKTWTGLGPDPDQRRKKQHMGNSDFQR